MNTAGDIRRRLREERIAHLCCSERDRIQAYLWSRSCYRGLRGLSVVTNVLALASGVAGVVISLFSAPDGLVFLATLVSVGVGVALLLAIGMGLNWMADMGDIKLELLINALDERRALLGPASGISEARAEDHAVLPLEPTVCPQCLHETGSDETCCDICGRARPATKPSEDEAGPKEG